MTVTIGTTQFDRSSDSSFGRRERAGWVAAWVLSAAALVTGLYAIHQLANLPSCEPLHRTAPPKGAPRADASYADALMARDWNAAIASESRLGLAAGRVRTSC